MQKLFTPQDILLEPPVSFLKYNNKLKEKQKCGSFANNTLYFDIAFVQHHDLFTKAEPNTTAGFTGTEKRNKDLLHEFGAYTNAIVRHFDNGFIIAGDVGRKQNTGARYFFYGFSCI